MSTNFHKMRRSTRWDTLYAFVRDRERDERKENLIGLTYYPLGYCSHPIAHPIQCEILTMGALPIFFTEPQVSLYPHKMIYHDFNFNTQLIVDMKSGEKADDWQLHKLQCGREIGELLSPSSVMLWDITAEFSYMITEPSVYVYVNEKRNRTVVFEMKEYKVENTCPRCGYGPMTVFSYPPNTFGSLNTGARSGYKCLNCGYKTI